MLTLFWIILMTCINGAVALAGIFSFLISKKALQKILLILVSLSIGSLLGGALFHFIPEAIEKLSYLITFSLIVTGILVFFLMETLLHWHHCHYGKCEHPFTYLILYGDAMHNFIDGLIIASSFLISVHFGILTSLVIISHELPQELEDFGVLVYGGFTKRKALFYNFFAQLTAILGGILGYYFLSAGEYAIFLLPFAAGGFIYIALKDLVPEVLKEKGIKRIINFMAVLLGLLILISVKFLGGN